MKNTHALLLGKNRLNVSCLVVEIILDYSKPSTNRIREVVERVLFLVKQYIFTVKNHICRTLKYQWKGTFKRKTSKHSIIRFNKMCIKNCVFRILNRWNIQMWPLIMHDQNILQYVLRKLSTGTGNLIFLLFIQFFWLLYKLFDILLGWTLKCCFLNTLFLWLLMKHPFSYSGCLWNLWSQLCPEDQVTFVFGAVASSDASLHSSLSPVEAPSLLSSLPLLTPYKMLMNSGRLIFKIKQWINKAETKPISSEKS